MNRILEKVKASISPDNSSDETLLRNYVEAAIHYAECYQHVPSGTYAEHPMSQNTEEAIVLLAAYYYERGKDSSHSNLQVWNTVSTLLRR